VPLREFVADTQVLEDDLQLLVRALLTLRARQPRAAEAPLMEAVA
jgi:hypothetical protein